MKKLLLILSAFALSLGTAMADSNQRLGKQWYKDLHKPLTVSQQAMRNQGVPSPLKSATRAAEGFDIRFCDDLASWTYLVQQNKLTYKCYIYITPEMAASVAGNKITSITMTYATDFATTREGSVFVTESLDGAPTTSTACTYVDCYALYQQGRGYTQTVALKQPYTIQPGVGFYFGYEVKTCRYSAAMGNADYPIGIDGLAASGFAGFVEIYNDNGELMGAVDMAEAGTNLFLYATTEGPARGFENLFQLGELSFNEFTMPVFGATEVAPLRLPIRNIGGNEVTSIEYSLDVNGQAGDVHTLAISVAPQASSFVTLPTPNYINGYNRVTMNVKKVNGVEMPLSTTAYCIKLADNGYDRKFVVEEGTGTWCGYCPRGIVGLQKMSERYPDTFIGIAMHYGDNLQSPTYAPLANTLYSSIGFPNCFINRDPAFTGDPSQERLEDIFSVWREQRSPAKIELAAGTAADGYKVVARTTFNYDETGANYRLAFAILEDGLTGQQSNYYANNPNTLEWWDSQGSTVNWTYDDTAIDIFDLDGIQGSIPSTIQAGQTMTYEANLSGKNVTNRLNTSIVALLLEGRTGVILNAAKVKVEGEFIDGIEDVAADAQSSQNQYYNLQGMRVQNAKPGTLLIRQQGNKVVKTIVR